MERIAYRLHKSSPGPQPNTCRSSTRRSICNKTRYVLIMVIFACISRQHWRIRALAPNRIVHFVQRPIQSRFAFGISRQSAHYFASHEEDALILEGLNHAQVEAVTQPLSSITRVVAGPGAGKTRVLTSRIAYLLQNDEPDRKVLAVTFTRKAAGEMQERLNKLLLSTANASTSEPIEETGDSVVRDSIVQEEVAGERSYPRPSTALDRVTLGTFHSVCAKILRWYGKRLMGLPSVVRDMAGCSNATNLDGNFVIIDQLEQVRHVKDCETELGMDLKVQNLKPQNILNAMGTIKSKLALGQDPMKDGRNVPSKAMKAGAKMYPLYRQKLLARNSLDFDDLILTTRELLTEHEDIRDQLQRRWQHVLVDEFQDTSKSQLDLVKLLSSNSLLVVGDADQSIYSWRGAHAGSMQDFLHEFGDRLDGVHTVYLMENYRSTTNIVRAAQKIISSDSSSSKRVNLRQDMKPMRGLGPKPRVLACVDAKAEASFVVKSIQDMLAGDDDLSGNSSVAVIYRTNAQSRAIEEACVQANMPYVLRGTAGSFYKRVEIQDCLCFVRLLCNGRDESAMKRAIKTPSRGIGDVAYEEFRGYCAQVEAFYEENSPDRPRPTPFDVLLSLSDEQQRKTDGEVVPGVPLASEAMSKRALNRFLPFSTQMRLIRDKAYTQTVAGLLSTIIDEVGLRNHIDTISKSKSEFSDRWSNVIELCRAAQRYNDDGASLKRTSTNEADTEFAESTLGNFLDDVALVTDMADGTGQDKGAEKRLVVSLMTIHASKGMEFDCVFLVGNEDGTLPTKLAIMEGTGSIALDEEKRLCYVAMTRAKTHLIMTWRREVSTFNGNTFIDIKASRSRFLDILVGDGDKKTKRNKTTARQEPQRSLQSSGHRLDRRMSSLPYVRPPARSSSPRAATTGGTKGTRRKSSATSPPRISGEPRSNGRPHVDQSKVPTTKPRSEVRPGLTTSNSRNGTAQSYTTKANDRKTVVSTERKFESVMDSTWFYPIGSSVVHKRHGTGTVMPPPPLSDKGDMLVRVQFEDGTNHDLPVDGHDLRLDLTF